MEKWITDFGLQLKDALDIADKAVLTKSEKQISNVLICGMGGSGIGGSIVAELVEHNAKIPVSVNKNYTLPEYVSENTLVIISSYSGDTEETISAFSEAMKKDAKIICVTSGGKILKTATEKNIDHILVPAGFLPRATIGYSVTALLSILSFHKIIDIDFKKEILQTIEILKGEVDIQKEARQVAEEIAHKIPIIYAPNGSEGAALRFQQDLNENAKILAWHSVIPEMNHNELLGWRDVNENLVALFLRDDSEHSRVQKRIEITKDIIMKKCGVIVEIFAKGNSKIERTFYHIHMSSWISFFLAEIHGVSPDEMEVINNLKVELSKF